MQGRLALAALLWAASARAQVAPNRATAYLHPTDVHDARAVWVNPAGLGVRPEASVHLDLAVDDPGASGRLRQITAGFNSRGLSFAYQRDIFDGGIRGHTYRVGLGAGQGRLAAGAAVAHYRGDTKATGWDVGVVYDLAPALTLGGLIANLGQPVVRGLEQRTSFHPGVTWRPVGPYAALSAHARFTADSVLAYGFGLRWNWGSRFPLAGVARLETDGNLRRGAFAFGLSIGRQDIVGVVATTPGDAGRIEAASLYGVATRPMGR